MPNWVKDNLSTFITIAVISMGGIISFTTLQNNVDALETRVEKLEASNENITRTLNSIDKKMSIVICKIDPANCLFIKE